MKNQARESTPFYTPGQASLEEKCPPLQGYLITTYLCLANGNSYRMPQKHSDNIRKLGSSPMYQRKMRFVMKG